MRRVLLRIAGALVALAIVVVLAFRLSPWPSVAIIEWVFAGNDAKSEAALARHVPPGIVTLSDVAYGAARDERADVFYGDGAGPQPTVVWVHGGAWIAGSKEGIANYLRILAGRGFTAVALEYSTGFGSAYPRPVEQVNAALAFLLAHAAELRIDPGRIAIAGDSAGAQVAAQVALLAADPDYASRLGIAPAVPAGTIKGAVLVSGAFDLEGLDFNGSYGWFLETVLWAYSGVRDVLSDERFRLASIVQNVTAAFPPSFVSSGNGDPLEPQARRLADRLAILGVPHDTLFFPAALRPPLPHEYQFDLDRPEGTRALEAIVAFLHKALP
jgi:acetyl esterase/lipase